jgi:transposase
MSDRITKGSRTGQGHRVYRLAFKQQVVQETLEPGASVSVVARGHDMNANVVYAWRKQYREGKLVLPASNEALTPGMGTQLLAVDVMDMPMSASLGLPAEASAPSKTADSVSLPSPVCEIEVELGKRRVRIRGLPLERAERFLQECLK